ncbi:zinc finger protein ztf-16 [Rhipicephalus sanguineus]|nr:zinc finger protein ztf-16 [Rhipicephalus sanguineus]
MDLEGDVTTPRAETRAETRAVREMNNNTSTAVSKSGDDPPPRDNRSYECDVCFMRFTQFANMRRHKLSHSGIRPFECRLCLRRFFRKDHLVEHTVRKHSKQRPLRCPFCAKTFPSVPMLKCHLSNAHSSGYTPRSNICNICGFVATSAGGAKIHYMTYHVRRALRSSSPTENSSGLASLLSSPYQGAHGEVCTLGPSTMAMDVYRESSEDGVGAIEVHHIEGDYSEISPRITSVTSQRDSADKGGEEDDDDSMIVVKSEMHESITDTLTADTGDSNNNTNVSNNNASAGTGTRAAGADESRDSPHDNQSTAEDHGFITSDTGNWTMPSSSSSQEHCSLGTSNQWSATAVHGNHDLGIVISPPPTAAFGSTSATDKADEKQMRSTPETSTADGDSGVDMRYPSPLACQYCDVVFYDRTLYLLHRGAHSFRKPWRCNLCGHQCKHRYDFASHLLAHPHI